MTKARIERTTIPRLACPDCGRKYDSIIARGGGQFRCYDCRHLFADQGEEIPKEMWKEDVVDAVRCDRCGDLVTCTDDNVNVLSSSVGIVCPNPKCDDSIGGVISNHLLVINYRGSWYPPSHFLSRPHDNELREASSTRDRIALSILNREAQNGELTFRGIDGTVHAKILWVNGDAAGCYTFTAGSKSYDVPMLHQIFVRSQFRRKGFTKQMLRDFLKTFPKGDVGIESPTRSFIEMMVKTGAIALEGNRQKLRRIRFF